ncbi:MAG: hypothetical protein COT38_03055 [Candidatus Omnitrophica bacterium CG08_land_8_20_14_0_20_41_16]|uniref:Uncharacterized protein n=1 Tax=Candidatus Sherwoodlollariibacterium unditelluris TaxID=1974757 RepID=A0A2G9YLA9_9BACT|nr:MAG: hypothetical protein COX41_02575 [Candidatus Omnitrophica bacterium CG23_combo_of_CG06-09_8_20_14_all_41_10]PIS33863.1 MAG: hypothetical protein COT38_03055 [Candidatus Omnitrophica bacterium CG08_land_8_20_14_0_20_41_16]
MTVFYSSGCLLPFLIVFNLIFGRLFFNTRHWLTIEGVLILLFMLYSYIFSRRIINSVRRKDNVIDVEGEIVKEKEVLKK